MTGRPDPLPAGAAETFDHDTFLDLLSTGDLRILGRLPRASNFTFLAEVGDDDRTAMAVYKPRLGEAPLWDFPHGTLYRREAAAYVLARALGWPSVPPTVIRGGPHGTGAVQLFVEADPGEHFFTLRERSRDPFLTIAAFDAVANNADRKGGHCLIDATGSIWVIDHGVCFAREAKLRTVIWDFAGEPVPDHLRQDLRRAAAELASGELHDRMAELLDPAEIEATARRAEELAATGTYPFPRSGHPYPWPPI